MGTGGRRHDDTGHPGNPRGVKGADQLLRYRDGARRLTNLKHLAEILQEAETRERYSPTGLAAWFTRARANAGDRDEMALLRLDSDEQLVKIVTMHAAKGLEFPIVFCPFLWDASRPAWQGVGRLPRLGRQATRKSWILNPTQGCSRGGLVGAVLRRIPPPLCGAHPCPGTLRGDVDEGPPDGTRAAGLVALRAQSSVR